MIYKSPTNFIREDGTLDIGAVTSHVTEYWESDPTRQQIRLPIDSTSLAVLRKAIGVVNNLTPEGGVQIGTNALVNGIVDGYIKSRNYVTGTTGWSINADGSAEFSNVIVRGYIAATTGTVGGWTINATSLQDTAGTVGMSSAVTDGDDIRFWAGHATPASAPFYITEAGLLKATTGVIGPWTLSADAISTGDFNTVNTLYFGTSGLSLSDTFKVTDSGDLTAKSGVIGGWNIGADSLYATTTGTIKTGIDAGAGYNGVVMDKDGLRGYDDILGVVFNLPSDGTPPSFSSGTITETAFEISTNAVLRTSATVGDGTANSAGILINSTGLYGCAANQTPSTANVKVLIDGTAVFNASIRGGQTDFDTGTGYFLGLSGGDYKFSIGNQSTNFMTWDGTYLKLKGSFDVGSGGVINNSSYTVATLPVQPTIVGYNNPSGIE